MKSNVFLGALLLLSTAAGSSAMAAGCIKGAVVGGVAGHMAGHGVLGAAAGCAIGHHEANKQPTDNDANKGHQSASNEHPK